MSKKRKKEYVCRICGRATKHRDSLCSKHFDQIKQYGFALDDNPRRESDANEYEIKDTYIEIFLYDFLQERIDDIVLVDLEDEELIKNIRWDKKQNCIVGKIREKNVLLPNHILGVDNKIEYINGNIFDNRRDNLRIVEKRSKKSKNPYVVSKKNKNKVIVEFLGESHNGVVGSSILCSYPTKNGEYEKILIEMGMVQKNGALREEYIINKEVVDRVLGCGELKGVFISHAHLSTTQDYYQQS